MSLKGKMVFPVFGSDFGFFVFAFPLAFWACSWPFRGSVCYSSACLLLGLLFLLYS